jgi:NDP-sugar pyrophosphorylase family protein
MSQPQPRLAARVRTGPPRTRLSPLSHSVPTALLAPAGTSCLALALEALDAIEVEAIEVVVAPGEDAVADAARELGKERRAPLRVVEGDDAELPDHVDALLLLDGEAACRWPLRRLVRRHLREKAVATGLIAREQPFLPQLGLVLGDKRRAESIGQRPGDPKARRRWGAPLGAWLFERERLREVPENPLDVVRSLLGAGERVSTLRSERLWHRPVSFESYLEAVAAWTSRGSLGARWRRAWVSPRATRAGRGRIRRSSVEEDVRLGRGVRLERSAVLAGAILGEGSSLRDSIVGPGVELPAGTELVGRVVTSLRDGRSSRGDDSVVGRLVYTPVRRA